VRLVQQDVVQPYPKAQQDDPGAGQVDHQEGNVGKAGLVGETQPDLDGYDGHDHDQGVGDPTSSRGRCTPF
jgi:hypothetical protein